MNTLISPPFYCDNGYNIHLGESVFINSNCIFLDAVSIHIGKNSLIGPNCQLYTPQHPINYIERRKNRNRISNLHCRRLLVRWECDMDASGKMAVVDMDAKTLTWVTGLPGAFTVSFGWGDGYAGAYYLPVAAPTSMSGVSGNASSVTPAIYKIDAATGVASQFMK